MPNTNDKMSGAISKKLGFSTPKVKVSPTPKPKTTTAPKPKATPIPKFTVPSVAEFRKSAAYKTDSMGYKEYTDIAYAQYLAKYKKK
jgi:hypothetical protein